MNRMTYKVEIGTNVFAMNRGIDYWVSLSFNHLSSLHKKAKHLKKD